MAGANCIVFLSLISPLQTSSPNVQVETTTPVLTLAGNYNVSLPPDCAGLAGASKDQCEETRFWMYYPAGMGPAGLGHPVDRRPIVVTLRGGNENVAAFNQALGYSIQWIQDEVLDEGLIVCNPNFPVVGGEGSSGSLLGGSVGSTGGGLPPQTNEDYETIVEALAYLIQYLRANADWLNIDPDRVLVLGRSGGAMLAYALAYRYDYQDLGAADPAKHFSSRPNAIAAFSGATNFVCFAPNVLAGKQMGAFFPDATKSNATLQDKLDASATWWLLNPQLFNRDIQKDPPAFMGYNLAFWKGGCGQEKDPHSGLFGYEMQKAIDNYVDQYNKPGFGKQCSLLNTSDLYGFSEGAGEAVAWFKGLTQGPPPGMYLMRKSGGWILNKNTTETFLNLGATSGNYNFTFFGISKGAIPLPSCGTLSWGLAPIFFLMGAQPADPNGRSQANVFVPAGLSGLSVHVQVLDAQGCLTSNVLTVYL